MRHTILALLAVVALLTLAPAAFAHGRGHAYGHRGYRGARYAYAPRYVSYGYAAPACGPRYVSYGYGGYAAPACGPGYVAYDAPVYAPGYVVYPATPYVAIGTHIGRVGISAVFGPGY
jgi:hypothetical protein